MLELTKEQKKLFERETGENWEEHVKYVDAVYAEQCSDDVYLFYKEGEIVLISPAYETVEYWDSIMDVPQPKELLHMWQYLSDETKNNWRELANAPDNYIPAWDHNDEKVVWVKSPELLKDITPNPAFFFAWDLGNDKVLILNNTNVKESDWYEIVDKYEVADNLE